MRYLVKRLLAVIPVLFGVSVVVFSMLHLVPGDPVKMMLSEFQTSPEQIARLRAQLYLDESLPKQFGRFLWNAVHGDLGYSMRTRRPVGTEILESLPSTVTLASKSTPGSKLALRFPSLSIPLSPVRTPTTRSSAS